MDPEKTAPFELGSGDPSVLLIHGFTGSPWDLRLLGDALAARGFHVKGLRLPGHGATPEAFATATQRDWEQACEDALGALAVRRPVFVAGLSMGSLLALRLAARFPAQVAGLALMAPALQFRDRRLALVKALRRVPVLPLLQPHLEKNRSDLEDPAALAQAPILPRVPTRSLHDLLTLQEDAEAAVPNVRAPTLVVMARQDHVVDYAVGDRLVQRLGKAHEVRKLTLERGFHIMTRDLDHPRLSAEVGDFFQRVWARS